VKAGARSQNPEDRKQSAKLTAHRSEERGKRKSESSWLIGYRKEKRGKRKEKRGKRKEDRGKRKSESSLLIGHSAQGRR
jgi:hypothetical protein